MESYSREDGKEIFLFEKIIIVKGWEAYFVEEYAFDLTYIFPLLIYFSCIRQIGLSNLR